MERVAFLIEKTGDRITCLLNPESLVQRRSAGVRSLSGATGIVTGRGLSDDPLAATGGGITEFDLDLLFDIDLARDEAAARRAFTQLESDPAGLSEEPVLIPPPPRVEDVREMTRPLWALAENAVEEDAYGAPPVVRMIWGRAWNVLGIVVAVAERLERFSHAGVPGRAWLRMRLRRVTDAEPRMPIPSPATPQFELPAPHLLSPGEGRAYAMSVAPDGLPVSRLDQIAADVYGDPGAWRAIATYNDIDDPLSFTEGAVVLLPDIGGRRL